MNSKVIPTTGLELRGARRFARDVGVTFVLRIAGVGVRTLTGAITARALGVEGKGILAIAILLPQMLALFLNLGIGPASAYFAGSGKLPIPAITSNAAAMALLLSGLGIGLTGMFIIFGGLDVILPGVPAWVVLLALLVVPPALFRIFLSGVLQGIQRIATTGLVELGRAVAILLAMALLVVWFRLGLAGALVANVVGALVTVVVLARLVRRVGGSLRPRIDRDALQQMLRYGIRGYIGNLLTFFNYRLDLFVVNGFLGAGGVGIYSVAVTSAELLWHLPNAVGFVIFPKAAGTSARRMNAITPRVFGATLAITGLGALVLGVIGEDVIRWVYSDAFAGAYVPLLILLPGVVLLGGGKVLTNEIAGRGYPHYNSINAALALGLTIALDVLLIPRYGVIGAAVASTIAYAAVACTAVAFYLVVRRRAVEAEGEQAVGTGSGTSGDGGPLVGAALEG
ncbi:MAG TPA: polysaccharide biosynthesis C-terminal domain-containing protein [Longimicrobiales bacterium]